MAHTLAQEGFRAATSQDERVFEAAKLFQEGRSGSSFFRQATLLEAFSTSDFPILLGNAFQQQAIAAQRAAVREFDSIFANATLPSIGEVVKLVDFWSNDEFESVGEGEEYKGGHAQGTDLTHQVGKYGKSYGLTFELRLKRRFSDLANFPLWLGNGAVRAENSAAANLLVADGTWNEDLFGTPETVNFSPEALDAALKKLAVQEDHRGDLVDTSNLVLLHGPGLASEVNRVLSADRLVMEVVSGGKTTKSEIPNPYRGLVTPLVSRRLGKALGANQNKAWALVQGPGSTLPSLIRTGLEGHDGNVDIRVKRDQGQYLGGGDVPVEEGSFNDDTIWYRGRTFFGLDKGWGEGVYASNGA